MHAATSQSSAALCEQEEVFSICYPDSKIEAAVHRSSLVIEHLEDLTPDECKRRYWWVAACVILGVFGVVLLFVAWPSIVHTTPAGSDRSQAKPTLLLDDILDDMYAARWFNGTWESDTEFSYLSKSGQLWMHDMETMTSTNLLVDDALIPGANNSYFISPDRRYVLVRYNTSKRFRHVYHSRYSVIDLEAQTSAPLLNSLGHSDQDVLQLALWGPIGSSLAYVYRNNIYYRPAAYDVTEYAVTDTGIPELVYNGATDWIYYDAVFGTNHAISFSTNGSRLAYPTFNDTDVTDQPITFFGEPGANHTQYSHVINLKYPKAGTKNPTVALSVVDLTETDPDGNRSVINIPLPENISEPILSGLMWINDEELVVLWKNRVQNQARLIICNCTEALSCNEVWREDDPDSWVDLFVPPRFSSDGARLLFVTPQEQEGGVGRFPHLTLLDRDDPEGKAVALTYGEYTVIDVRAWDEANNVIFFTATLEGNPASVQLFAVPDDPTAAPYVADCVTCEWRTSGGNVECLYGTAYFSTQASFYVHTCLGPDVPQTALYNRDHDLVTLWDDNQAVRDRLRGKAVPRTVRMEVPVPGGLTAQVKMWLPPDMDPHAKYPLLVDVYAGPDSQQISEVFEVDWRYFLTANKSVVYAVIDGRGSGRKGDKTRFAAYRKFGTVEIEDQISVTKYLLQQHDYLDSQRTAIWGWSYGGYSTLMTLASDADDVFKCGIAVAPVTDWTYYSSMYTERKMGMPTPEDNLLGYQQANVNDKVESFRHKKLFLIHGTFDNIVPYHNTMMLTRALQEKKILFKQQIYPDEDHALAGVTHHLYLSMIEFLEDCFEGS